jgi:hypothetical protein
MRRWRKSISAARAEHDLFGKSVSTLGSTPRAGFFRIMLALSALRKKIRIEPSGRLPRSIILGVLENPAVNGVAKTAR